MADKWSEPYVIPSTGKTHVLLHPCDGILSSNKKGCHTDACNMGKSKDGVQKHPTDVQLSDVETHL